MSTPEIMQAPAVWLRYVGPRQWADSTLYEYTVHGASGTVTVSKASGFARHNESGQGRAERTAATPVHQVTLADRDGKTVGYVMADLARIDHAAGRSDIDGWPTTDPHVAVRLCGWHLSPDGIVGTGGTYNPGEVSMWRPLAYTAPTYVISLAPPVGAVEIAERLGVARATVDQWRQRGLLPDPDWIVGGRPAWRWDVIATWAAATDRL